MGANSSHVIHEECLNSSVRNVRIYAVSDLHCDHKANWELVQQFPSHKGGSAHHTVLLVAGDVSADLRVLERTLRWILRLFDTVAFVPGNNELRLTRAELRARAERDMKANQSVQVISDSREKLRVVLNLCRKLGVRTEPFALGAVLIVPLLGWYTPFFDSSFTGGPQQDLDLGYQRGWLDFRRCVWATSGDPDAPSAALAALNRLPPTMPGSDRRQRTASRAGKAAGAEAKEDTRDSPSRPAALEEAAGGVLPAPLQDPTASCPPRLVVTFSHFLPRRELLGWLPAQLKPTLPLVAGDARLERRLRAAGAHVHVYGHTHIDGDTEIEGVRYIQHSLGHPSEREAWWKRGAAHYVPKLVAELLHIASRGTGGAPGP